MFLEHFTGFPAMPISGRSDDPLFDPLVLGVLTTALEDESADAYQRGFRDGLRTAALTPTDLEPAEPDDPGAAECDGRSFGEGDWHR